MMETQDHMKIAEDLPFWENGKFYLQLYFDALIFTDTNISF